MARVQRFDMAADRPCAWVLPVLVGKLLLSHTAGVSGRLWGLR